jgi:3-hydroxybutyryl-CoA dehydratase
MTFPPHLVERRLRVDRAAIRLYAEASNDYNPIHLDPEFAARTPMGGVIAHGLLSMSLIWQSLAATFGTERVAGIALEVRFIKPVREDIWVSSGGTRVGDTAAYDVWVKAELDGGLDTVIAGTATMGESS